MIGYRRVLAALLPVVLVVAGCGQGASKPTAVVAVASEALATARLPAATPAATRQPQPQGMSEEEAATLNSLRLVDEYPLYIMRYYGDHGQGLAPLEGDGRSGPGRWAAPGPGWACSLFAALGDEQSRVYGRNFDWQYSPALLLFTDPPDGYASVSVVDIAYLIGEDKIDRLAELPLAERRGLLEAPNWPFDGMNEEGLAVGMAAVPPGNMQPDPRRPTIGSLGVIRLMLDGARDVDEAVSILQDYNIDMDGGPPLHYLVADRSGRSVLVEFYQGEVVLMPGEAPWQVATNFLRASVEGSAAGQCPRYDRIEQSLTESHGRLNPARALDLLAQVAQQSTQWSVVYDLSTGEVGVAIGQQYNEPYAFHLGLGSEVRSP